MFALPRDLSASHQQSFLAMSFLDSWFSRLIRSILMSSSVLKVITVSVPLTHPTAQAHRRSLLHGFKPIISDTLPSSSEPSKGLRPRDGADSIWICWFCYIPSVSFHFLPFPSPRPSIQLIQLIPPTDEHTGHLCVDAPSSGAPVLAMRDQ